MKESKTMSKSGTVKKLKYDEGVLRSLKRSIFSSGAHLSTNSDEFSFATFLFSKRKVEDNYIIYDSKKS